MDEKIKDFFDGMEISQEEKEEREKYAEEIYFGILFILSLFSIMDEYQSVNIGNLKTQMQETIRSTIEKYMPIDRYLSNYIDSYVDDVIKTTIKNKGQAFNVSTNRAYILAVNQANDVMNYADFLRAVEAGKTKKTWVDVRDERERETHREVGGMTIGIEEAFPVGDTLMMFPRDTQFGATAEEIANCRCSLKYS